MSYKFNFYLRSTDLLITKIILILKIKTFFIERGREREREEKHPFENKCCHLTEHLRVNFIFISNVCS